MAGSSFAHSQISHNLTLFLAGQLRKVGCQTAGPDLRIRVMADEKQLFTYPDFVVICGKPEFAPDEFHNLINPKAIIEILSPSTQAYDRTTKAEMYRSIPTLQELAFIAQDRFFVEHLIRQNNNAWLLNDYTQVENSFLFAGCEITLAQIYELVEF